MEAATWWIQTHGSTTSGRRKIIALVESHGMTMRDGQEGLLTEALLVRQPGVWPHSACASSLERREKIRLSSSQMTTMEAPTRGSGSRAAPARRWHRAWGSLAGRGGRRVGLWGGGATRSRARLPSLPGSSGR